MPVETRFFFETHCLSSSFLRLRRALFLAEGLSVLSRSRASALVPSMTQIEAEYGFLFKDRRRITYLFLSFVLPNLGVILSDS